MKFPWLSGGDIERAARALRMKALGDELNRSAHVDLDTIVYDHLCEKEQLSFDDEHDLGREDGELVLGRTKPLSGKIEITVRLKQPADLGRYRFTLAHEIGHWVLHRPLFLAEAETLDLFGPTAPDASLTSLNRSVFPDGLGRVQPPEEWQANRFAVALLVDAERLRQEFSERFGDRPVALDHCGQSLRQLSRTLASRAASSYEPLCAVFGLSTEAMAIALEERGYAVRDAPLL